MNKYLIFILSIFSLSLISALQIGNIGESGVNFNYATITNYSTINVNDSTYHQGLTPQQVANLFNELDPNYFSNPRGYVNQTTVSIVNDSYYLASNPSNFINGSYVNNYANIAMLNQTNIANFSLGENANNYSKIFSYGILDTTSPSYENSAGRGARTSLITTTSTLTAGSGTFPTLVDGLIANGLYLGTSQSIVDKYITFDFGAGSQKLITEARWIKSHAYSHGTWQWQGSDDNSTWTSIGETFILGNTTFQYLTSLSGNTNYYRYYRLLGISGTTNATIIWEYEIEFKIADKKQDYTTSIKGYTDGSTKGNLFLDYDGVMINSTKLSENGVLSAGDNFQVERTGKVYASSLDLTNDTNAFSIRGVRFGTIVNIDSILLGGSGKSTMTGVNNFLAGTNAGSSLTTAGTLVSIGSNSCSSMTTQSGSICIGSYSGYGTTGSETIQIGVQSGYSGTGAYRTSVGHYSGGGGGDNSFFGYRAGQGSTTGGSNTGVGMDSLQVNKIGIRNSCFGERSCNNLNSSYNTMSGWASGYSTTNGTNNIYLGYYSGYYQTTESNQLIIDSIIRGNKTNETTQSLIYGKMDANPLNQFLTLNVKNLTLPYATIYLGSNSSITDDGTNLVIITNRSGGENLAWFSNNISATGYLTRTSVYDKTKGNALSKIKDASEYLNKDSSINHSAFYGSTSYKVIDYSKPVINKYIEKQCEIVVNESVNESIELCKDVEKEITIYPYTKKESGVDLGKEIDVLRQSLFEVKDCTAKSKNYDEYKLCIGGV